MVVVDLRQLDLLVVLVEMVLQHLEVKLHNQELLIEVVAAVVEMSVVEFQQVQVEMEDQA